MCNLPVPDFFKTVSLLCAPQGIFVDMGRRKFLLLYVNDLFATPPFLRLRNLTRNREKAIQRLYEGPIGSTDPYIPIGARETWLELNMDKLAMLGTQCFASPYIGSFFGCWD